MSGYKRATVSISEEEYRRLHQTDMEQRFKGHTRVKAKASTQMPDLTSTLQQMESRQRQLEQALSTLDQNFNHAGAETMQSILTQNTLCYESLAALIEETALHANSSLAFLSQRFTEEMQREREQYSHNLQSLVQRLDEYEQKEEAKAEAARQWLSQSVLLAEFIQEQYDHERFLPGRLFGILASLDFARNNLTQGFLESSLQTSQQAFLQLSELRIELEQRIVEWQTAYESTQHALGEFIAELKLNSNVHALGLDGEELAEQVDVAYWSNGKYQQLLDKCRHLLALLLQDQGQISTEELTRTQTELLPILTERFEAIIYEARLHALNSQLRMNIAERALQALEIHGFTLSEAGYVDKDMRAPFMAQLGNSDGSRVTIQVLPPVNAVQELASELVVTTNHPYIKTEQEARLQWDEVCRSLNQYNLNVSRPTIVAASPLTTPDHAKSHPLLDQQLIRSERKNDVR